MKFFQLMILLISLCAAPLQAQEAPETNADKADGEDITIQINIGDDVDETNPAHTVMSIKNRILDKIASGLNEADLSDEDREEVTEILEKLKGIEDLEDLKKLKGLGNIHINTGEDPVAIAALDSLTGTLAILLIFGTPIMIVALVLYSSYRKRRLMHDTISQYVANGKDVPPEVIKSLRLEPSQPKSNLHKGMVMVGVGLGIFLCFILLGTVEAAALGLIPLFIGLAQILIWKLESKDGGEK